MKYGVCFWMMSGSLEEKMQLTKQVGLEGVSLEFKGSINQDPFCKEEYRAMIKELLVKYGLEFPTMGVNGLCDYGMSKPEDEVKVFQMLDEAIEIAKDMGVTYLQLPSLWKSRIEDEVGFVQTAKCLSYACEKAKPLGIYIGHESLLDAQQIARMNQLVRYENYFVFYDGANLVQNKVVDPIDVLEKQYNQIKQVHIKDRLEDAFASLYLGEGESKVKKICKILKENGYDGWIFLESLYKNFDKQAEILNRDCEIIKELFA